MSLWSLWLNRNSLLFNPYVIHTKLVKAGFNRATYGWFKFKLYMDGSLHGNPGQVGGLKYGH